MQEFREVGSRQSEDWLKGAGLKGESSARAPFRVGVRGG